MTVTTNERGQQNLFAKEPEMYVSPTDAERYQDSNKWGGVIQTKFTF